MGFLDGGFNSRCYTSVHGFLLFPSVYRVKLFLIVGTGLTHECKRVWILTGEAHSRVLKHWQATNGDNNFTPLH